MNDIHLYNTRTRRRERLEPLTPGKVGMYVCGPTVYDRAHLGNARPVVVFDVLYRLLRHTYGAENVTYVRNFTDVDDKINARAAETGRSIREITDGTIAEYHADMDALGALRPTAEPRATDHIGGMIAMIEGLIAKGNAYEAEGHVLFDVRSYPAYGQLSGRSLDDMIAGARVEVAPFKRDPMDFVLWKPSDEATPGWDSPWGRGRPGWHIECSAMSEALLGPSFDIHGGGIDLQFPHHENEIAQSACAHPEADFAKVWMHNEMLLVEGRKMSKSLGNFVTVRELLDRGVPGEVIRFVLLGTHYSKPMDWTEEKARQAEATLRRWSGLTSGTDPADVPSPALVQALSEDLNTSGAIAILHSLASKNDLASLKASIEFLGLRETVLRQKMDSFSQAATKWSRWAEGYKKIANQQSSYERIQQLLSERDAEHAYFYETVARLLAERDAARALRDFVTADRLRDRLVAAGLILMDGMDPAAVPGPDFNPAKLIEP